MSKIQKNDNLNNNDIITLSTKFVTKCSHKNCISKIAILNKKLDLLKQIDIHNRLDFKELEKRVNSIGASSNHNEEQFKKRMNEMDKIIKNLLDMSDVIKSDISDIKKNISGLEKKH